MSRAHGIIAIRFVTDANLFSTSENNIEDVDESLGQFVSILFGRLLKIKILRQGRSALILNAIPVVFSFTAKKIDSSLECEMISSYESFEQLLGRLLNN